MRNSKGVVWGGLLVIIGTFWLLRTMDLIHIRWREILPYWPVLLILAGVILLVTKGRNSMSSGFVSLFITMAVFGAIFNKSGKAFNRDRWGLNWHDDNEDYDRNDNNEDDDSDEDTDDEYLNDRKGKAGNIINGTYNYPMEDFIQKAKFSLEGGAGSFKLEGTTSQLFEATTESSLLGFVSKNSINKLDNSASVDLKMEDGDVKIKNGDITNRAKIKLNDKPVWDIDLGIGAGNGDFDFSNYKVEKLKLSTGVADIDLRLGDKNPNTDVKIEAGVASVTLELPGSTACEMFMEGALNSKEFEDLEKVGDGHYRTPGFEKAKNKVTVKYEGGLTSFKIKRY